MWAPNNESSKSKGQKWPTLTNGNHNKIGDYTKCLTMPIDQLTTLNHASKQQT